MHRKRQNYDPREMLLILMVRLLGYGMDQD